jgi:taurine dioxygenase
MKNGRHDFREEVAMIEIRARRLSDTLGCEIRGAQISAAMSDADFRTIEDALHEHLVVIVRDQKLTPEAFVAFARRFGRPEPHVIDQFHHKADPNILILSNRKDEKGEPIGLADGGTYFHSDYSYLEVPARCTLLHALEIPGDDAGTTFANQRQAYEDLPETMKRRIDPLICRHYYANRDDLDEDSRTAASKLTAEQKAKMHWVLHPLVRRHPYTGRKSLYAVSGTSFSIEGMDEREGRALLDELKRHSTQPKYCFKPEYHAGDVVVWDNCSVLHCAPLLDPNRPRTLWRITVKEKGPTM